jgi:predicted AAA+ superfamily ATPase
MNLRNRAIKRRLLTRAAGKLGRIVVLTGARQTGKTTLVRHAFPETPYVSLEDPAVRPTYSRMSAVELLDRYPRAVFDEVQKVPSLVETVKAAHDSDPDARYLLLGSSQILLLSKVKESLAGRAAIEELWPLTIPEMMTDSWEDPVGSSRFLLWLSEPRLALFDGLPVSSPSFPSAARQLDRYLEYGGMPVVQDPQLTPEERYQWLRDFQRTYLERDVTDLAALRDLEPFVVAQRVIAARTGRIVNFSDLARSASISPDTARRFLRYLELSYQVLLLPPFFRNLEKRLSKSPKVHVLDPGILRVLLNRRGELTGEEFESAVVSEIWKQIRNAGLAVELFHLRTYDRREVDLLLELETGFVPIQIKKSLRVGPTDGRSLRDLEALLDKPVLHSFVLSLDREARELSPGVHALPVAWALSPPEP